MSTSDKKEEAKEAKPKGTSMILMPLGWQ